MTRTAPGALLIAGFALAIALRVAIGGVAVADSVAAGLAFAAVLALLTFAAGTNCRLDRRSVAWGLGGAAVLLLPALLLAHPAPREGTFLPWALVVTVVATAEEAFLRGALFDALTRRFGDTAALVVTALCFAGLHLPLYGWHAMPLDLAVGLWLGALRRTTGTWTAPAIAHGLADLVAWWL